MGNNKQVGEEDVILKVSNLSVFNKRHILMNISFKLRKGSCLAILGPNESGKTVLLLALCKILDQYGLNVRGDVYIFDKKLKDYDRYELSSKVNIVLQDPDSQLVMPRVDDEVAFGLENMGMDPDLIKQRVEGALSIMGLQDRKATKVWELSGGQRQRLAVASILSLDPDILLLDNPLAQLDTNGLNELVGYLKKLKSLGKGIIITTYKPQDLIGLADEALILSKEGSQVAYGNFKEITSTDAMLKRFGIRPLRVSFKRRASTYLGKTVLEAVDVYYSYGKEMVVKGVNLAAREGEIVGIVGPNGAGKTTLGKMMAGILKPIKGYINIRGKRPGKGIATYLFQDVNNQLFGGTVKEDIAKSLVARGLKREEAFKRAEELVSSYGLNHLKEKSVFSLSEGIKRLVALVSSIALEPKVIILDEVSLNLDWDNLVKISNSILQFPKTGITTFVITHDIDFIMLVADRILVMKEGHIVKDVTLSEEVDQDWLRSLAA